MLDGDGRTVLTAADYVDGSATPPQFLSLASCHSGYPDGDDPHEPLGLALAALGAGVDQVVSSTFELDSRPSPATDCLTALYAALEHTDDVPVALAAAQRACRAMWRGVEEPLYRWAIICVIGAGSTSAISLRPDHDSGQANLPVGGHRISLSADS